MHLLDLPLTTRDDLERPGIDPATVVAADSDTTTIRLTHDQLTALARRTPRRNVNREYGIGL